VAESYTQNTTARPHQHCGERRRQCRRHATLTLSDPTVGSLNTGTFGGVTSNVQHGNLSAVGTKADVNAALAPHITRTEFPPAASPSRPRWTDCGRRDHHQQQKHHRHGAAGDRDFGRTCHLAAYYNAPDALSFTGPLYRRSTSTPPAALRLWGHRRPAALTAGQL